jgi:hypothetical protein
MRSKWLIANIKHSNYYGIDHDEAHKRFEGDIHYLGDTCIHNQYKPVAVYHARKPNRTKGHKDYVFLSIPNKGTAYIQGMDKKDFKKQCIVDGLYCNKCNDVIYSTHRHGMISCSCGQVSIDGGKDYTKISGHPKDYTICQVNLMTQKVKFE